MSFTIRTARNEDVEHIATWTRDTFSWGDYVAESLADWLAAPGTLVLVAVDEVDRPVAMSRVQMLSATEGWLSAARVRSDARRKGLGTLLNNESVRWVRDQGGLVVRLAIEDDNPSAQKQVTNLGYKRVTSWISAEIDVAAGHTIDPTDKLSVVGRSDVDPAWIYWSTSAIAESARALMPSGWQWRRATVGDIDQAAREQRLFSSAAGWIVIEQPEEGPKVVWAATSQNDFPRLIDGLRHLGWERQAKSVRLKVPDNGWTGEAVLRAGGELSTLSVYSKPSAG